MTKTTQRVFGLDLMRAIAILLVLFSHCRPFLTKVFPGLDGVSEIGLYGVELFFVLSGFLIGGILIKTYENETSFKSLRIFWYKRWFRTMPNYYLFLIVNIVMFSFFAPTKITEPIISYFFFLQNFAWPKTVFFSISWSLCIEEWFYMLYPSAVLAIKLIFNTSVKKPF
jgi:peptidoglycan/LPS O-acetylase OafA/YrhL